MSTKDELARRRSVLSPEKRALLEKRLHGEVTSQPTIPKRPAEGPIPASFTQQRFWFLQELEPESTAYNEVTAWQINGYLHPAVLMRAIREIVQRHEVLRTTFQLEQGQVQQVIHQDAHLKWELPQHDLRQSELLQREAEQLRLITAETQRPFRLHEELPWRIQLLQLAETQHILLINMHHIVIDEWAMQVFLQELTTLYAAFSAGQPAHLANLPIQYADYAYWQQQQLAGEVSHQQLTYWKQQLGGTLPLLDMPTDRPRPHLQSYNGQRHYFTLPHSLHQALQVSSLQAGATLFMTLLATFNILLFRYSGQEDILVGSPIAGRAYTELEHLIGCFFNTVVLRSDLSGAPTYHELIQRVRTMTLAAYEHQDIPLEKLIEELHPIRDVSRPPLFQVAFVLQNMPQQTAQEASALSAFTLSPVEAESHTAKVDLLLNLQETPQELAGYLEYNTDLFYADSIDRFVTHFQRLLEGVVADPLQPIDRFPLLSSEEQNQLLYMWNATAAVFPESTSLHELFEAQVSRTPQALALICDGVTFTYHELNQRANQLAHHLQKLGVAAEVFVGLCMERSVEQMVSLLGILKAGGAYIPIDPAYPQERIAYVLNDAQIGVLLTQEQLLSRLPPHTCTVICLDRDWQALDHLSRENPSSTTQAGNSAYVIYTSGSTGTPKGVLVPQRAVVNHCTAIQHHYQITPSDRVLHFASLSFDAAVEELFPAWCSGATVVSRPRELPGTFVAFVEFMTTHGLTILDLPTAYWQHWVEAMEEDKGAASLPATLRLLIVGGEEAKPASLTSWLRHVGNAVRWSNTYGPTEATVTTTIYDYTSPLSDEVPLRIPIGRPLANALVYVLDRRLQPVPIGVPGELYIGGKGIASGYLNRAELTNERFIANPFLPEEPGARLYRTGDLVRYRSDGNLEFLGRIDQQVKIRGFRIELGEIESVLNEHLHVWESVVLAQKDALLESHLVAYVILQPPQSVSNHELWHYLQERLPDYMLPGTFVEQESFPLTTGGKIDRQSLLASGQAAAAMQDKYVPPRTPLEEVLTGIWANVLEVEQVGIHDNFFMRGGHSLLATRLIARLQSAFEIAIPLRRVFEAPMPARFAEVMLSDENERENIEAIAELLLSLSHMSDEEVEAMLE